MTIADTTVRNGQGGAQPSTALAIRPGQDIFDDKQRAALSALGIKNASNADLAVFMHYCQKTGLDPFSKQIYMLNRREHVGGGQYADKRTIQIGIEGFRVIRDRAARRDGVRVSYGETVWYDADGIGYKIWLRPGAPAGCGMVVFKDGEPFPAVLTFAEYVQTNKEGNPTGKWANAPAHQLEKCCEAYGLRRAFPHDLGGLYIEEEVSTADAATGTTPPMRPRRITSAEVIGVEDAAPGEGEETQSLQPEPVTEIQEQEKPRQRRSPQPEAAPVEDAPIANAQIGVIGAHGRRLGYEEHEAGEFMNQIALLAAAPGLADIAALTAEQGEKVLDRLGRCKTRPDLVKATTTGELPLEGGE
jgi:phage recombination protein Bet